ncbi:hypothetical protein GGI43DRAFT_378528 [Trichoderma evansii]
MDNDDAANIIPVPWGRLKAWIEAQEKAEQSGHNPNPPKRSQILALSHVVDFMDQPEPTQETIGKLDYVSELMQLASQAKVAPPRFTDLAPIDVPIGGVLSQRWRTVCVIPSHNNKEFPCLGHGLREGTQLPLCKSKKISKQYAAKYAYLYMKGHSKGSTSSNGGAPLAPPARNPTPANNNVNVGSNSSTKAEAPSGGVSVSPSSMLPSPASSAGDLTNGGTTTAEDTDFYDNPHLPTLLDQVKKETAYLKLGYPFFEIVSDPENPALFAGRAVFKIGGRTPKDLGHINGALTRGLAKELVAEEILKYCKTERERREGLMGTFKS